MRKFILLALWLHIAFYYGLAYADSNLAPYVSVKIDAAKLYASNNFNDDPFGIGFIGAIGMQYKPTKEIGIRAEVEATIQNFNSYNITDDYPYLYIENLYEYKPTSFLMNFYMDRDFGWKLKPYGMFGMGLSSFSETMTKNIHTYPSSTDREKQQRDNRAFAFTFGAGFLFNIMHNLDGDIGMRYLLVEDKVSPATMLSAMAGIHYTF